MNDQKLTERIKNNDPTAFRELVESSRQLVFTTCLGFVHNKADAEDLTQEVFIEAYRSIDKFRGASRLTTWLYRIAVNKSLNHLRDNKKNRLLKSLESFFSDDKEAFDVADHHNSQPLAQVENKEKSQMLHRAINSLPENQRTAFILNKYQDLPYKEVAEIMDTTLSSIESLMHRAKKNLQKKLFSFYKKE